MPDEKPTSEGLLAILERETQAAFAAKAAGNAPKQPASEPDNGEPPEDATPPAKGSPEPNAEDKPAAKKDDKSTPADPDEPPAHLSERSKADWKGLRDAKRKAEDENASLKARIAELEASAPDNSEVETLRKQLADYEERLTVTNLERHPKFEAYFNGRTEQLLNTAKTVGGEKIVSILQLPEGEYRTGLLREAFADLDPVAQSRLGAVLNDFESLNSQRKSEISRAREAWQTLQAEEQKRAKAQQEQAMRELDDVLARWSDPEKGVHVLQPKEGDREWNSAVEARKKQARDIYAGRMGIKDMANAAIWAAIAPDLASELNKAQKREAELREEIAQLKAAKPTLDGGNDSDDAGDANLSFLEAVNRGYRR